jgi:three-Cys-motif partner protein
MTELSSGLSGKLLDRSDLPEYEEHHAAKHGILREYTKAWLPKLGISYPQVAIVDGFASAGRYRDGREGSPLIFLNAYLDHTGRSRLQAPPHFIFIESVKKYATHLRAEIDAVEDLHGATVDVIHGSYEKELPRVVAFLAGQYRQPVPAFAFVDPRGYNENPFEVLRDYRRRLGPKAEAMVYVPIKFMARFVGTDLTEDAMDRAFGSRDAWLLVRAQSNPGQEAGRQLAQAYTDVMRSEFSLLTHFIVDPVNHNEYYLFFGTEHLDGIRKMKDAYWKIDPDGGTGYQQDPRTAAGQGALFSAADVSPVLLPHDETLPVLLRAHFELREFSIEEAVEYTLTETRFRDAHLRPEALIPMQNAGKLEVTETTRTSKKHFPPGTRMRFVV